MKTPLVALTAFVAASGAVAGAFVSAGGAGGSAAAAAMVAAPASATASYSVDTVHSSVVFRVKHNDVAWFWGRFDQISGSFELSDGGSFDLRIKPESVHTGNEKRDNHLRSPDFFSVKEYDRLDFKSTSVKRTGDDTFEVAGDLTIRGVTKPVTVTVEKTGEGTVRGNTLVGVQTKFTINRSDFGMTYGMGGIGDEVLIIASLEAQAK